MKTIENVTLKVTRNDVDDVYLIHINEGIPVDEFRLNDNGHLIEGATGYILNHLLGLELTKQELQNHLIENYLEKEEDVEEMTNKKFAQHLINNINGLYLEKDCVKHNDNIVYMSDSDNINFVYWHNRLLKNKIIFCKFNGCGVTKSKNNRKKFLNIIKHVMGYFENFEIKGVEINE